MKFAVSREALLRPLQLVSGVVERRQTLPVLSNLLLSVEGNALTMTGTDLEVQLVAQVELEAAAESGGEITVPARKLMDIWRALPEGAMVEFALDDQRAILRSGRSRFQLATLPATEFPSIDEGAAEVEFSLAQEQIRRLIDRTAFSMAQQDVRYFLNGMLLEVEADHVRSVATDGHRLAMCTVTPGAGESRQQIIIPRKGVLELSRLLSEGDDQVGLAIGANHLRAAVGGFTFITKLVDGKFPDYERVVPRGGQKEVLGDRLALREAFQRTAILSNEKYRGVRITLGNETLTIQANNPEQEEAEEAVAVDYEGEGLEIGFNVSYLLDVLGVLDTDRVRITVSDANSSALVEEPDGGDSLYVVMPMRL
ncbi:MAG TPA: DNA polymerase III subunit beta [Pseudomonadales bacterium]|nr:DNA polymerase III subunit beta [Pseudomonadales bacterium]